MFCTNCGKQIDDNLSFCIYCGKPTKKTGTAAQKSPTNAAQPNNANAANQPAKPVTAAPQPSSSAPGKPQTTVTPTQSRPVQQPAPVANTASVAQPAAVATASVVAATGNAKPKSKLGFMIGIVVALIVIIVAAILAVTFIFGTKSCYRVTSQTFYDTNGEVTNELHSQYFEDGAIQQYAFTHNGSTSTTNYSLVSDGFSAPSGNTGTCQTDSNGNVISTTITSVDGKTQTISNYEYYSPGVIKRHTTSTMTTSASGTSTTATTTREYDEDGWVTKYESTGPDNKVEYYSYEFASDGKSTVRYAFSDQAMTNRTSAYRYVLDNNNYIAEVYGIYKNGEEKLYSEFTYQKIEHPASLPAALSRLKN